MNIIFEKNSLRAVRVWLALRVGLSLSVGCLLAAPVTAYSQENAPLSNATQVTVALTQAQQTTFGMQFSDPEKVSERLSFAYSGLVSRPATQLKTLSAPADGLIVQVLKTQGRVAAGEVIIELQSLALLEAQQAWLNTQANLTLAMADNQRAQTLLKSGVVAQKQAAHLAAQAHMLQQELQQRAQTLTLLGMTDDCVKRLQQTRTIQPATLSVMAPSQGAVQGVSVQVGQRVSVGQPLAQWLDVSPLSADAVVSQRIIDVHVPLQQVAHLQLGQAVVAHAANHSSTDQLIRGTISLIDFAANPLNQTVRVQCHFDNADLMPGALVKLAFGWPVAPESSSSSSHAYRVASPAVIKVDGQTVVFVRQAQQPDVLVMHAVQAYEQPTLIKAQAQTVIVTRELLVNAQVVTQGLTAVLGAMAVSEAGDESPQGEQ